jgi:hypothetical protein
MGVQAASLANLRSRAAFEPSNKLARRYSDVDKAIRLLRHAAPDPVALCIKLFRDENAPVELRGYVRRADVLRDHAGAAFLRWAPASIRTSLLR